MIKAARIFQNGMMLQREKPVRVWGEADAGTEITAAIQGKQGKVITGENGRWEITLPPLCASEEEILVVSDGNEKLVFLDVAIGEIWLAGGQSNMEFHMRYEKHLQQVKETCSNKRIRFYDVPEIAFEGQEERFDYSRMGMWRKASEEDIEYFSAAGYYFQCILEKELDVPAGIVGCNWGGTRSAAWMNPDTVRRNGPGWMEEYEAFASGVDWKEYIERQCGIPQNGRGNPFAEPFGEFVLPKTRTEEELMDFFAELGVDQPFPEEIMEEYQPHNIPGVLYEHMVKKVAPFSVRGVLWYQGESDDGPYAGLYGQMLTGLIDDWRKLWGEELPFLVVQLPGFEKWLSAMGENYALIREGQEYAAETMPQVYICSISDTGERLEIHSKDKKVVGERLALLARGHVYGQKIMCDAPKADSLRVENGRLILSFEHAEGGLALRGNEIQALKLLVNGEEAKYHAELVGEEIVIIPSEKISGSVQIAFAKEQFYIVNLYNQAGIPAIPFVFTVEIPKE